MSNIVESANIPCQIPEKPIISDLLVEDLDSTLVVQAKEDDEKDNTILSDDFDLLEGLTTGHFDEKNKLLLRTVSNPELHMIDDLPEEIIIQACKLTRSTSQLDRTNRKISLTDTNFESDNVNISPSSDDNAEPDDQQILIAPAENPLIEDDDTNDDDDVWCNPEDEDNLQHCLQVDQERIHQLQQELDDETFQLILEALQGSETDIEIVKSFIPKEKHHLIDSDLLLFLSATRTMNK
ncbi:hypothetical protein I4U23_020785 [Adineta vaga]|nr:hypothetical protein I4U23_020785 [Adineta vaga]